MTIASTKLAIAAGAAVRRLRRGDAVVGVFRTELTALLTSVVVISAGRPTEVAGNMDPGELIDLMVGLCRSSGMSGPDMAARFNEAVERRAR